MNGYFVYKNCVVYKRVLIFLTTACKIEYLVRNTGGNKYLKSLPGLIAQKQLFIVENKTNKYLL